MVQVPLVITTSASSTLTITARPLSLSGSRAYDATTSVAASDLSTISNLVGSETITLQEMELQEIKMLENQKYSQMLAVCR